MPFPLGGGLRSAVGGYQFVGRPTDELARGVSEQRVEFGVGQHDHAVPTDHQHPDWDRLDHLPESLVGPLSLGPLNEQRGDERGLNAAHDPGPDDLRPVRGPERLLTEPDDGAGRQVGLGDAPPPELAPVEQIGIRIRRRRSAHVLTGEQPQREPGRVLPLRREAEHPTAHRPAADVGVDMAVDRGVRPRGQLFQYLRGDERPPCPVLEDVEVVDHAPGGQRGDPGQQVAHWQSGQVLELHPAGVGCERPPGLAFPVTVVVGRPGDNDHAPGVGVEAEGEVECPGQIPADRHPDDVRGERPAAQLALLDRDVHDRRPGEQVRPVVEDEVEPRRQTGDHDIDFPAGVLPLQQIGLGRFEPSVAQPGRVDVLVPHLDPPGGTARERRTESAVDQVGSGRPITLVRVDNDDELRRVRSARGRGAGSEEHDRDEHDRAEARRTADRRYERVHAASVVGGKAAGSRQTD